jgi:nitrite reductase (NADH) large subunit
MKHFIIAGDGPAGVQAAQAIRQNDKESKITIFTKEGYPFYYRPRLPDYIAGTMPLDKFTMLNAEKHMALNIDLRMGDGLTSVDAANKTVTAESGTYKYDGLLLATGAHCFMPPVEGGDKKGVFSLRTVDDAEAIAASAKAVRASTGKAVLIGGGLLGLEAGHALTALGLTVEVVEFMDRLLPRQMDAEGAAILKKCLEGMGFVFHLGAVTSEVTGGKAADGVTLKDGTHIPAGLVLFSAGVRSSLKLANTAGVAVGKGVIVDEYMRTSVEGIWAAGDCAEFKPSGAAQGIPGGIWPVAMAQGRTAGLSMAADGKIASPASPYTPQVPSTSLKVVGVSLTSAGDIDSDNKLQAKRCSVCDPDKGLFYYRKIVLEGDVIRGFIFLGDQKGVKECTAAANAGKHLGALADELDKSDFDFSSL